MALMYMPKKSAIIILLVLGVICLGDGIAKKNIKETLVGVVILIYAIVSLITGKGKSEKTFL